MNHRYLVFAFPVLMLADYFLTVAGAKLAEKTYRLHFKFPDYELNPLLRKDIAQKRWVSVRHLVVVVIMSAVSVYWFISWPMDDTFFLDDLALGAMFGIFVMVDGAHLANLLTFHYMNRHPDAVSGEVGMSQTYLLKYSQHLMLRTILPIGAAALFVQVPFLYGALGSLSALFAAHWIWEWRGSKKARTKS